MTDKEMRQESELLIRMAQEFANRSAEFDRKMARRYGARTYWERGPKFWLQQAAEREENARAKSKGILSTSDKAKILSLLQIDALDLEDGFCG